jgi:glycosyltransferase involved in cell wall biosynthesis
MQPWLSIVLPSYNVQPYLRECFESIAAQWEMGIEVIVVDDCSTDDSAQELERIKQTVLPSLVIEHHNKNRGLSATRNTGLTLATGHHIWFLDSDDILLPNAIDDLRRIIKQHSPDLVMCDFRMIRSAVKLKHRLRGEQHRSTFYGPHEQLSFNTIDLINGVFHSGQMHTWSKISRRAMWSEGLSFPEGRFFEDAYTTPDLLLRTTTYFHRATPWVGYRQRAGSILATMGANKVHDMLHAFDGYCAKLKNLAAPDPEVSFFGVEFHLTRNFLGACKHLRRMPAGPERDAMLNDAIMAYRNALPSGLPSVVAGYLKRLWLNRLARLVFWLNLAPLLLKSRGT